LGSFTFQLSQSQSPSGSQGLGFAVAINTAKKLLTLEDSVWVEIAVAIPDEPRYISN